MKKTTAGLCLIYALAACRQPGNTAAQTYTDTAAANKATVVYNADAPVMKFENDVHNFGKIAAGDKVTYAFIFNNTGKSPLIITEATATCGCTTPEFNHAPIKPGGRGMVKVTFNSAGKSGQQDKMITVTANTNPAQTMVHLTGEVTPATK